MQNHILGLDIGGTKIQAGLVNPKNNRTSRVQQFPMDHRSAKHSLQRIEECIDAYKNNCASIGIGIAGHVIYEKGLSVSSAHFPAGWKNVPLKKIINKNFRKPVAVDNDANCIALAEAIAGKGKKYKTVMSLTIGTGIGAGLVMNKNIFRGGKNAVEFGHIIIDNRRSFESLVSGKATIAHYKKQKGLAKTSYEIMRLATKGDRVAKGIVKQMSDWLAIGLANAVYAYSPDIIIISGGLAVIPSLIRPAITKSKKIAVYPEIADIPIVQSSLGYDAGVIGAALLTKQKK